MEININQESVKAVSFVKDWLLSREDRPIEHNEEWEHFVLILAECYRDYKIKNDDEKRIRP